MAAVNPAGPDPMMTMRSCTDVLISVQYNADSLRRDGLDGGVPRPDLDDPLRRPPVPQLGPPARREAAVEHLGQRAADLFAVAPAQPVRADLAGDRPLGVLAQRQARHAERSGLLLNAARVGEH